MDLCKLTLFEAHNLLKKKEISSVELSKSFFERIETIEDKIGAYITVTKESALKEAEKADERIKKGDISYLTGIPLSIKDLMCTKGVKTTCASKMLENFIPPYDAFVIKKLKEAGAVILGKTNMDEFAMGSSNENSNVKKVHNPWDVTRVPGGSSGGSAASVSADMCISSLGSDTGGSIRQPASFCGVTGLKPTYGRVSRFGLIAFASSLDQIGPITKDVQDSAMLLETISGFDENDSTSSKEKVPTFFENIKNIKDLKGVKIGVPDEYLVSGTIDDEVYEKIKEAVDVLKKEGAEIINVSLPHTEYSIAAYYIIAPSEASSNLARYDGVKYGFRDKNQTDLESMYKKTKSIGFGDEVIRRIILGTYALSAGYYDAFYKKASQIRTLIIDDFKKAFAKCDILIAPTTPTCAFKIGDKLNDPLAMYFSDIFTISANLAGIPAMSLPCGFSKENLPIGMQFMGNYFDEEAILKAGIVYQNSTTFHKERPKVS